MCCISIMNQVCLEEMEGPTVKEDPLAINEAAAASKMD